MKDGKIVTRPLSNDILAGVTRKAVLALAREKGLEVEERLYSVEEMIAADEAFITGASTYVCPVIAVDGHKIGDGEPGPVVARLLEIYLQFLEETAI